jgi:hypothetical protein
VAQDIITAVSRLSGESLIFITIDTELPKDMADANVDEIFSYFNAEVPAEISRGFTRDDFGASRRDATLRRQIGRSIDIGLRGRRVRFQNLISVNYNDGHKMYTAGGILINDALRRRIGRLGLLKHEFVRTELGAEPIEIPRIILTRKERLALEKICLGPDQYDVQLGIPDEVVEAYKRYYRFLPNYSEVI